MTASARDFDNSGRLSYEDRSALELKDSGELPKQVIVRSSKYLNNLIEQNHRRPTMVHFAGRQTSQSPASFAI